jgi:hypothetical protein
MSKSECNILLFSINITLILLNPAHTPILMDEENFKKLLLTTELNSSNREILSSKIFPRLKLIKSEKYLNMSVLFVANTLRRKSKFVEMEEVRWEFSSCREESKLNSEARSSENFRLEDVKLLNFGLSEEN